MTPREATERQIEAYRQMTSKERLRIGLRLHEASCEIAREAIRANEPGLTDAEVEQRLRERIRIGYRLQESQEASR